MNSWRGKMAAVVPRLMVVGHDLLMVWLCWEALHHLRYAMLPNPPSYPLWSPEIAIVLVAQGLVFWWVGLYRGLWRFASVPDLGNILKASLIGLLALALGLALYNRLGSVPRAVLVMYPFLLVGLLGMPRLMFRAWKDNQNTDSKNGIALRVLILGAGRSSEALVRDLRRSGAYQPVGLLDDSARLQGTKLHGVPVLGGLSDASTIAKETAAKLIVIAMPSLDAASMQRVVAICESTGLPFRTVPRLVDVLEGRSLPGELKEVAIDDLLGRKPITPDWKLIRGWLGGRTVLVTGAGGSIGSELCRQCARHGASKIALLEVDELALVTAQTELHRAFPDLEIISVLGNCGDPAVIQHALKTAEPDAVFHAAAYKQVPLLEKQLREAVQQRAGHRGRGSGVPRSECGDLRLHFHRQGGRSGQRTWCDQAFGRNGLSDPGRPRFDAFRDRPFRQCAGFGRKRGTSLPRADPLGGAGDGYRSGGHALFHDHSGSLPADRAGRRECGACVHLHAGHGRTGADSRARRADDPSGGKTARQGHRHRLYRIASRREIA